MLISSRPSTFRFFTSLFLKIIPTILFTPTRVLSTLTIYSESQAVLGSFSNVDFVLANSIDYGTIKGRIEIVSFANSTTENPCRIDPLQDNIDILVVPFELAFSQGCRSYADILKDNGWYKDPDKNPAAGDENDVPTLAELVTTQTTYETVTGPDGQVSVSTKVSVETITVASTPGSMPTTITTAAQPASASQPAQPTPAGNPTPTAAGVVPTALVSSIVNTATGVVGGVVGGVNTVVGGVVGGVNTVVGGVNTVVGGYEHC